MKSLPQIGQDMILVYILVAVAIEFGRRGLIRYRDEGAFRLVLAEPLISAHVRPSPLDNLLRQVRGLPGRARTVLFVVATGSATGIVGLRLIGPLGLVIGASVGALIPRSLAQRRSARVRHKLERQLAEVAEATGMAVRSGLSIVQALEFAAQEANNPMSEVLGRYMNERRLGLPFEEALHRFADELASPDARLFTLVVGIHARSGGNLGGAVDEVAATIRHRIAVRRELRALSAQGRISGSILGALPIAFFLVLAATSQRDLAPVYRSPAGVVMISSGLLLEGLAFLWVRRLLRVEA
jgi:tight adherence protein B